MLLNAEITLVSLGQAAVLLGAPLKSVTSAAAFLRIRPAECRDGVPWFHDCDVERIREYLAAPEDPQC